MRATLGCGALLLAACCGCCCGRLPTFGLGPTPDEAEVLAALQADPVVVDRLCRAEVTCEVADGAVLDARTVGWNPLTGTWVTLVAVEARCRPSEALAERAEPLVCAGVLAAVATGGALTLTDDVVWALPPGVDGGGGGDWDWD